MNYDEKIKKLMARLVSMSPEPPPYPEDAPIARHEARRAPRPVLVFAGAAVAVALLGVPLLLFTGEGEPAAVVSSTTTTTTALEHTTTTTVPETTTSTAENPETTVAAARWESIVYLIQQPEDSFLGNPALVPVWIRVDDVSGDLNPDDHFPTALAVAGSLPPGLDTAIPSDVQILDVTVGQVDGEQVWVADMNEDFAAGAGGLLADTTMLNQLVYTITQGTPEIEGVLFTVNGEPVDAYGSEGIGLTAPVTRETFIDDLNVIFLTEPIMEVEHVYIVAGRSNTFEGSLAVQVVDSGGDVVHEEFVQATCGSGCWGEFDVGIDSDFIVRGESAIRLLTNSAEDGSPRDIVTATIPDDGLVWDLTPEG